MEKAIKYFGQEHVGYCLLCSAERLDVLVSGAWRVSNMKSFEMYNVIRDYRIGKEYHV